MRIAKWLAVAAAALVLLAAASLLALSLLPQRWLAALGYGIAGERLVTGMLVVGTPSRPVLYVSSRTRASAPGCRARTGTWTRTPG